MSYHFWDIQRQRIAWPWKRVRGCSRSLKTAPFDRPHTTFYSSAIVIIALSCTVFELFDVEYYRDLEIWVRGHSRSYKLVPFKSFGVVSYLPSIVTTALSLTVYEIFSVKLLRDLDNWVRGCSRSLKMALFYIPYRTFYLVPLLSYLTLNDIMTLKSGLEVTQGHSKMYHSKAWVRDFLFAFHSNYGSILHHLRDKARYWSKIVIFTARLV